MPNRNKNNIQPPTKRGRVDLLLSLALAERKLSLTTQLLAARDHELSAIYRLSEAIGSERQINHLCKKTAEEICRTLGVQRVCIFRCDEHTGDLVVAADAGAIAENPRQDRVKAGEGPLWKVMKTGKSLNVPGAGFVVPIKTKGETFGVISACGKYNRKEFSEHERDLLRGIANQAAIALDNAALHHEFENLLVGIAGSFAAALDAKSPWTAGHSKRVTHYAVGIAEKLEHSQEFIHTVQTCGLLHDIGKIGIPEHILDKPGRITKEEHRTICEHASQGARILEHIDTFQPIIPGVRHHHERWDGRGFPDGLKGENIPLLARLLAVADAFDAITSERPYHRKRSYADAIKEIKRCSGSQFDPLIVEAFVGA